MIKKDCILIFYDKFYIKKMRKYTLKEIEKLASDKYILMAIDGKVYDVTGFLTNHPGGADALKKYSGKDATQAFRDVNHSMKAAQLKESFLVG